MISRTIISIQPANVKQAHHHADRKHHHFCLRTITAQFHGPLSFFCQHPSRWRFRICREQQIRSVPLIVGSMAYFGRVLHASSSIGSPTSSSAAAGANLVTRPSNLIKACLLGRAVNTSQGGGTSQVVGLAPTFPNPDLKWETTAQTNVGIDIGLPQRAHPLLIRLLCEENKRPAGARAAASFRRRRRRCGNRSQPDHRQCRRSREQRMGDRRRRYDPEQ